MVMADLEAIHSALVEINSTYEGFVESNLEVADVSISDAIAIAAEVLENANYIENGE